MHSPISTAHSIRFLAVINTNKWYTTDNILGIFTEHTEMIPAARHGPSVWQSLSGCFPADDMLFEAIANFLTPGIIDIFQQI